MISESLSICVTVDSCMVQAKFVTGCVYLYVPDLCDCMCIYIQVNVPENESN